MPSAGHAGLLADEGHGGAVTLIQRFGCAAILNAHPCCLVLDGIYRRGTDGVPVFVEAGMPVDDELQALLQTVIARVMKMLTLQGLLVEAWAREPAERIWTRPKVERLL